MALTARGSSTDDIGAALASAVRRLLSGGMTGHEPEIAVERTPLTLQAGGVTLNALWLEPADRRPDAPPLVFLHEGLGSITQWTGRGIDAPARLAAATGRRALVYDRQGYGRSDPLKGSRHPRYLYDEAWTALPEVLDAAGIDRAFLIGHSDGATIALLFAARFPDRSAGVVCEAAHVIVEDVTLAGIRTAKQAFEAPDSRLAAALRRHHRDQAGAVFAAWAGAWLSPEFSDFDMRGELPGITAPVLAIQGENDEYGTPRQLELIAEGVAGAVETWLVPDCAHVPHHQVAGRVLLRIADFVRHAK